MDDLALLCNLYGNGPATLKRLKDAGCSSFDVLEKISESELADIVGSTPAAARRFLREAHLLGERVGSRLEAEEAPALPSRGSSSAPPQPAAARPRQEQDVAAQPSAAEATTPRDPLVERVLERWRERDAHETLPPPTERSEASEEPPPSGTPLSPGLLDGLDLDLCSRLRRLGIESLEELSQAPALDLSISMEIGLTRVARLEFLARRSLEAIRRSEPTVRDGLIIPHRADAAETRSEAPAPASSGSPLLTGPHPWPKSAAPRVDDAPRKFSLAEFPPRAAAAGIGQELERFARRRGEGTPVASEREPEPREGGSAGPFA